MRRLWTTAAHAALAAAAAMAIAACSSGGKPVPTPLQPLAERIDIRGAWHMGIGTIDFPLQTAIADDRFTVADGGGTVVQIAAQDGREIWRTSIGARLSAGVGSDGRFSAVVTRDNELVVLDNGAFRWRQRLPAPVATAPLVAGERVFVLGIDRAVQGFDVLDGRRLWTLQRPGDALTLASAGVVSAYRDTLLVSQGAKLASVDPLTGAVRWEVTIATPRGTNEVERLADLVGPAQREGDVFCMRAFQSAIGCVDAGRAALAWTQNVTGSRAVGGDADFVYGADANDRIAARRRSNGEVAWTDERLLYRELSAPARFGDTVVYGDGEGVVHVFARDAGTPLTRLPTDGSPVVGAPSIAGSTMLVTTKRGGLFAFRPG